MPMSDDDPVMAWRALSDQVTALVEEAAAIDAADGPRHVTRQLALALEGELEHSDPRHPSLHRYEAPWSQWGGPNPDNVYLRCVIDPSATYRLRADVSGVREILISLAEGDMHLGQFGIYGERALHELAIDADGTLELFIGPDEQRENHQSNWLPTDPAARILLIRQYQYDWEHDPVASFQIERVDTRGEPAPPPAAADIADAFARVATWVERSLHVWAQYVRRNTGAREDGGANALGPPITPPGGAPHIAYGGGRWLLAPDEALVVTTDAPDADYWSWVTHRDHWFDSGDFASRQTSLNHTQVHIDGDGRVRFVLAHRDPGVPNWLDTGGNETGMIAYRLIGARTKPVPEAVVVPIADVRAHVPPDHPTIDGSTRRDQLARRRAAALARYA